VEGELVDVEKELGDFDISQFSYKKEVKMQTMQL